MKIGCTLEQLAAEIERQHNSKHDFVAPTNLIRITNDGTDKDIAMMLGTTTLAINDLAHQQIAEHAGIPKLYYDRMRAEVPQLLGDNIQTWFDCKPAPRLVRALDNRCRAFLSDSYRPLDNFDLASAVLPTLFDNDLLIMSCELTEKRLYIKAVDRKIERDVPNGKRIGDGSHAFFDTLSPAIIISNSEVGYGRLTIESGIFTKVCTNLAAIAGSGMRKTHVGGRHMLGEGVENIDRLLTNETRAASDRAIFLQVRDVVKNAFDEAKFTERCQQVGAMASDRIPDVIRTVELSAKKFGLSDLIRQKVQQNLIENADLTRAGLFNAVTRTAQDVADYDDASDLERLGGRILELNRAEWRELAPAD